MTCGPARAGRKSLDTGPGTKSDSFDFLINWILLTTRDPNTHDMTSLTLIACYRWMNLSNKKLCSRLEDDRVDEDQDMMHES